MQLSNPSKVKLRSVGPSVHIKLPGGMRSPKMPKPKKIAVKLKMKF